MRLPVTLEDIEVRTELRPGDIGYVIYLHGDLYKKEFGYGIAFEAYVAQGFYEFYTHYDPGKDRVWVAEHGGGIVGFLLLMHRGEGVHEDAADPESARRCGTGLDEKVAQLRYEKVAQLRYFILDPRYRGMGLGKRLAALFLETMRERGYRCCYLWTTDELSAAAHIYRAMGFVLVEEKESMAFGKAVREQRYELVLSF